MAHGMHPGDIFKWPYDTPKYGPDRTRPRLAQAGKRGPDFVWNNGETSYTVIDEHGVQRLSLMTRETPLVRIPKHTRSKA